MKKFLTSFHLARMNKRTETPKYAVAMYIQTSNDNGDMNEKRFGGFFIGFLNNMLTPKIQPQEYFVSHIWNIR